MKSLYISPSIEVVEINYVDIVTESKGFNIEWIDPLNIGNVG